MTKSIGTGVVDTAISGFASLPITAAAINWATDFRLKPGSASDDLSVVNITTPVDQPEVWRFAQSARPDIYAGMEVEASAKLPIKSGLRTMIELRQTSVETDSVDATWRKMIPTRVCITVDTPTYGNYTSAKLLTLVNRSLAGLFEQESTNADGLNAFLHGVLAKKTLR